MEDINMPKIIPVKEIYKDIEISEKQIKNGKVKDAESSLLSMKKKLETKRWQAVKEKKA